MTIKLQTQRLLIRSITRDDWASVFSYMSDSEVVRWLPEEKFDQAAAKKFVLENSGQNFSALAVEELVSGEFVGHMVYHDVAATRTREIGWVIGRKQQGRGYASEAASALLEHAFVEQDCHRVIATCQPENIASWRVMEKIGMRREGLLIQCIYRGGGVWWDEYVYAILQSEFVDNGLDFDA